MVTHMLGFCHTWLVQGLFLFVHNFCEINRSINFIKNFKSKNQIFCVLSSKSIIKWVALIFKDIYSRIIKTSNFTIFHEIVNKKEIGPERVKSQTVEKKIYNSGC